jgi:hypothetical protein
MIQRWREARRERRILKAMVILAVEGVRVTHKEILFKSKPADCYGEDCDNCECDFGPDCD